jgi:cysteine desulfurase
MEKVPLAPCPSLLPHYFDYNATTPLDPRVLEAMSPYFHTHFGNASSTLHAYGWLAEAVVEESRESLAKVLEADPEEIFFTSGATESNNLALLGVARAYKNYGNHLISVCTEHASILEPLAFLQKEGFNVTLLPVNSKGIVSLESLAEAIQPQTLLVSVMAANNETGVLQPLQEIGAFCRKEKILFHCDATQALGKIPLSVRSSCIDLLSCSAHKCYGPKGIGALFCSRKAPRVQLQPLFFGGGQERGLRAGTLNVPSIVGFAQALRYTQESLEPESLRISSLRQQLYEGISSQLPEVFCHTDFSQSLPNTLNLSFGGVEGSALLSQLKNIAVSSGSACHSAKQEASYVLKAMGVPEELARSSLRISLGRFNTEEQIQKAILDIVSTVRSLRRATPSS